MREEQKQHLSALEAPAALERLYVNVRAEYPFSVRDKEIVEGAIDHLIAEQHRMASTHRQEVQRLEEQLEAMRDFLIELVADEWGWQTPPYTGSFEPMNAWVESSPGTKAEAYARQAEAEADRVHAEANYGRECSEHADTKEQLEAVRGALALVSECEDALTHDGYAYLVNAANEALASSPATKAEAYARQAEAAKRGIESSPGWLRDTAVPPSSPASEPSDG